MGSNQPVLPVGVEVRVLSRTAAGSAAELEVVAGRRFSMPGHPMISDTLDERGRPQLSASVEWVSEEREVEEERSLCQTLLEKSASMDALVERWIDLVKVGHERQEGQIDMILEHLAPMPPASHVSARAIWVAALINPLPGLGVAWEIRPAILSATSAGSRLQVALGGLHASIAHLDGSRPMR